MEAHKEINKKTGQFHFQKLTPSDEIDLGIYDDAIEYAFSNRDICNIALSGPYGAGKSSVIESYKKLHPEKKFIHISLAHMSENGKQEDISVSALEGKIINQLVHLIPVEQIPQTHFAVKRKVNMDNVLKYTLFIMLFLVLGGYLCFYNNWCGIITGLSDKSFRDLFLFTTKKEFVLLVVIVCLVMLGKVCHEAIKWQMNKRFMRKVNVKGNNFDIELFDTEEASYFDKYLNEVLYLFDNVDAHGVVFEDMDRYNTGLIFEGLKEINGLLNRRRNLYEEEKREPLRFIYLLRDDMFMTKERTKFFDYIIPIVPVIDGSNSYDKFIEFFRDENIAGLFEDDFLRGLSLYIDDMRILKNIVNEFVIYHGKFKRNYLKPGGGKQKEERDEKEINREPGDTEQNDNKLLAMIAYKNMFPRDFVELQLSRGYVYQLFHLKEEYADKRIKDIQGKIKELERKEKEAAEEECRSLDELDAVYYVERSPVRINDKEAFEFPTRVDYIRQIKENGYNVKRGRPTYGDYVWNDFNNKEEFDELLLIPEYAARKEKVENKAEKRRAQIQSQIAACRREEEQLRSAYLKDIITKENADDIFAKPQEDSVHGRNEFPEIKLDPYFPLIKYLIRNGYIDETYPDYMTFFYANSISRQDKIFLRSITDEKAKDYDYGLQNPRAVIARMRPIDFSAKECWNYDLLDALLEGKDSKVYRAHLDKFLGSLREWKPVKFVEGYIQHSDDEADFIREFNASWDGAASWVIGETYFEIEIKYQYIWSTFITSTEEELIRYNRDGKIAEDISSGKDFFEYSDLGIELISDRTRDYKIEKIISKFKALGIQFSSFSDDGLFKELLQAIYNENMYVLNRYMIDLFLEHMYRIEPSEEYSTKNLTLILSQEQPLAAYVRDNLAQYIDMEIKSVNQKWHKEDMATVLYVLNHKDVEDKKKMHYILLWVGWLPELSAVEDKKLWKELLISRVTFSQKNVFDYFFYSGNGMDETLTNYMNRYREELSFDTSGLDAEYGVDAKKRFFWQLAKNNDMENEAYRRLIQSFHMQGQTFFAKDVSPEKIRILIEEKIIEMSLVNLDFLRANYPEAVNQFIECDITRYIDVMTEEKMSEDEVAHVLKMDISEEEKIRLLKLETNPVSVMHRNYPSKVIVHILQHLLDENEKEQLFMWYPAEMPEVQTQIRRIAMDNVEKVIADRMRMNKALLSDMMLESGISIEDKKMLLANNLSDLWKDEVEVYLDRLDLKAFHGILEGKKRMFRGTEANISLLKAFQEKGWLSHFEVAIENENIYAAYGAVEEEANIS